ncbi:unnamed protein product, partial [Rotaria sordida]
IHCKPVNLESSRNFFIDDNTWFSPRQPTSITYRMPL